MSRSNQSSDYRVTQINKHQFWLATTLFPVSLSTFRSHPVYSSISYRAEMWWMRCCRSVLTLSATFFTQGFLPSPGKKGGKTTAKNCFHSWGDVSMDDPVECNLFLARKRKEQLIKRLAALNRKRVISSWFTQQSNQGFSLNTRVRKCYKTEIYVL